MIGYTTAIWCFTVDNLGAELDWRSASYGWIPSADYRELYVGFDSRRHQSNRGLFYIIHTNSGPGDVRCVHSRLATSGPDALRMPVTLGAGSLWTAAANWM